MTSVQCNKVYRNKADRLKLPLWKPMISLYFCRTAEGGRCERRHWPGESRGSYGLGCSGCEPVAWILYVQQGPLVEMNESCHNESFRTLIIEDD